MTAPDQEDRDRARFRLDANVVVEAGAGTGKTTLLTDRILFLVLGWDQPEPVRIEEVVALTFTEKAAGEIKLRLSDRLAELAALLSGGVLGEAARERAERTVAELKGRFGKGEKELAARARAALEDLDKAPIGTIHSFCAQLLRLHPLEAGVDPNFRVDEGEAFEELFAAEWANWLDVELGEKPPRREAWLELLDAAELEDLEELARELCSEKIDPEGAGGADAEAAESLRALARAVAVLPRDREKPRGKILEALEQIEARLLSAARAAEQDEPLLDAPQLPLPRAANWPSAWDDARAEALYEKARVVAEAAGPRGEAAVRRAASLLLPFARRVRREHARRGWISFDGLLRRARDLVRDHPRAREEAKGRFRTLLIDEFQDTDPLQGELILYLSEKLGRAARDWRKVEPAPGRVFVVGDPKQSIYRFRGADIAAYEGFVERLRATGALSCDLTANFRSRPGIVAPVNGVFSSVMVPEAGAQPAYKAIHPVRGDADLEPAVRVVAVGGGAGTTDADAAARAEAAWIAGHISERGRMPGTAPEGRRPLKDFAVLMRSSTALPALLEAFKRAGIPYAVEIERFFYEAPEVADFLNLLRALDEPADRTAVAGLLRSPLAALSDDGLLSLARAGGFDYRRDPASATLPEDERRRAATLFAALRSVRARAGRVPLGDVVAAAIDATRLFEFSARAYHGQQAVSNLLKLRRLAVEASDGRGVTLKEFAARVREDARRSRREGESPLADERLEAVRVMSIHKSKGLEFPVVFAVGLSGRPGGALDKPLIRRDPSSGRTALRLGGSCSAAMALADAREKEMELRESVRLLYVAMTRAKETLFLLGREKAASGALSSHLVASGAWPVDGRAGKLPAFFVDASASVSPISAPPAAPPSRADEAEESVRSWSERAAWRVAAQKPRTLAATAYLDAAGMRSNADSVDASAAGAQIGQLCHRVLQQWDFQSGGDLASALAAARGILERRFPGSPWTKAEKEACGILEVFLASGAARELVRAEILGREMPFAYAEGLTVVRGAADLVARIGGVLTVVDFKSERIDPTSAPSVRARYAEQGRIYVEAVQRAWGEKADFRVLFLRRPEL